MTFETSDRERREEWRDGRGLSRGNQGDRVVDDYPPTRPPADVPAPGPTPLFAGRYRIVEELGRGGMGVVSKARDTRLSRDVAIKVPLHFHEPDSLRRFFKEAEAAAKLDHPHICRILDLGEADGLPFIVLAFVEGRTLAEIVDRRPVDTVGACKVIRNIARTIQFAHDRGIVHRDLKPSNLMVGPRRELIVMDFGIARHEGDERDTRTGQVFGTPPYMSPEQVQGQARAMGKGCDIYTLGVIFYELLTGRLPFRGPAWDLPRQIIGLDPIPPSTLNPAVDREVDAIVLKAMAKPINGRFASMDEFAGAITDYLRGVDALSNSDLKPRLGPPPSPSPAGDDLAIRLRHEPLRDPQRPRSRATAGLICGLIVVLILIAVHVLAAAEDRAGDAAPAASKAAVAQDRRRPRGLPPIRTTSGRAAPAPPGPR